MKIMLIMPPQYDVTLPGLSLPCLAAVLHRAGHDVYQKDVNIESYDKFLTPKEVAKGYQLLMNNKNSLEFLGCSSEKINYFITNKTYLLENVEKAKGALKSSHSFYDYAKYRSNLKVLTDCLEVISLAYYGSRITFDSFKMIYANNSLAQIQKAVKDRMCNPYIDFYNAYVLKDIITYAPKVVGLSISISDQVIPGLTLAFMIKQALKNVHIVVGGPHFTLLKETLPNNDHLFDLIDSVIVDEGETALLSLLDCLEKDQPLHMVPNLVYRDGSKINMYRHYHIENLDDLPTPCFDDLPLDLYFSPEKMLPLYITRGCYWGKCTFCNLYITNGNKYRSRGVVGIVKAIKELTTKYNCRIYHFLDEAIPPNILTNMADEFIQSELKINWGTHARFEKQIDQQLCQKLALAGCHYLNFGIESASERILTLMQKGTTPHVIKNILSNSSNAGLVNVVSFFFGFPTETVAEAKETMDFVLDNIDIIDYMMFSTFVLCLKSAIQSNPLDYKIENLSPDNPSDMQTYYNYEITEDPKQKQFTDLYLKFSELVGELKSQPENVMHTFLYSKYYQNTINKVSPKQLGKMIKNFKN